MTYRILIILASMAFIINSSQAQDKFSVTLEPTSEIASLSALPSFKHAGSHGYYFSVRVSVSNRTARLVGFMVDDDCTFASWMPNGHPVQILTKSCLQNVFENIALDPQETYHTSINIWFPKGYAGQELNFRVGFVEIVDYEAVSGPYWSNMSTVKITQ